MTTFYLGCPEPAWMPRLDVPLFVSDTRLRRRKRLPRAKSRWALDSGGFTEISTHGRWTVPAAEYAQRVRRYADEIGGLDFASIQDMMCEPWITAKSGLTVLEHQHRTVASFAELRSLAPEIPWMPVIQGWEIGEYVRCIELYAQSGVDLTREPRVGLGSVCRRQGTTAIHQLVSEIAGHGLNIHGFGIKAGGLARYGRYLASFDSMSWSVEARLGKIRMPGCNHGNCNYCPKWAMKWRERILARLDRPHATNQGDS